MSEQALETALMAQIGSFLDEKIISAKFINPSSQKANLRKIDALEKQCERINYLFEKGRMDINEYERKYESLQAQIKESMPQKEIAYDKIKTVFCEGWNETYSHLDPVHKKLFWNNLIDKIIVSKDKTIVDIIFSC